MMSPLMTNSNNAATTLVLPLTEKYERILLKPEAGRTCAMSDYSNRQLLVSNLGAAAVAW